MKLRYRWAKGSMRKSQWQDFKNRDGKCMVFDCFLLGEQYGTTTSTMTPTTHRLLIFSKVNLKMVYVTLRIQIPRNSQKNSDDA